MFEGPHATNIFGVSSFEWWSPPVSLDRGGRVGGVVVSFWAGEDFEMLV